MPSEDSAEFGGGSRMREPRSVILPEHLPDQAFFFHHPVASFSGGWEDWGELDAWLSTHREVPGCDSPVPSGALVGGFSYEGDYYFEAYDAISHGPRETCLPLRVPHQLPPRLAWRENMSREAFMGLVEKARGYIEAGEIYQVNLARSFEREIKDLQPWDFFRMLFWRTQAPLAAMLPFRNREDGGERWICSSSPELFMKIDGRQIRTRPIKGTRPRDRDPQIDRQNAFELRTSAKEMAELIMITDLERNDLGEVCEYGSVQVPDLLQRVAFSHVHHLVSTVEGRLRSDVSMVEAVRACFPGGSITGAPKRRAMEIIRELEPESRGIYTGALGYFGTDGTAQFNIAIRSCELSENRIKFFTGSGITWESDPEKEFEETCHKAEGIWEAVDACLSGRAIAPGEVTF